MRIYSKTICRICGIEFQKQGSKHFLCSLKCKLHYRRHIRPKQKRPTKAQRRKWYLKSAYGLNYGEWDKLFESQNKCCAVCHIDKPGNINGWCTDHDHTTGKVRGILCHKCNTDIGGYDRVINNQEALDYLGVSAIRCHICNKDAELKRDPHNKNTFLPCDECLEVIEETLMLYRDAQDDIPEEIETEDFESVDTQRTL